MKKLSTSLLANLVTTKRKELNALALVSLYTHREIFISSYFSGETHVGKPCRSNSNAVFAF